MGSIQEHYLFSKRDEEESKRLNLQSDVHKILRSNNILEPHIPKQNIRRVADIATGTGAWLSDVAAELEQAGNCEAEFIGFDISDTQFPKFRKSNTRFVLSDIKEGFAEEWHRTFDVVHARLLVLVLVNDEIESGVKNILKLLKPGGYIQYDDFAWTRDVGVYYPQYSPTLSLREEGGMKLSFYKTQNWSLDFIGDVQKVLKQCPVEDIQVRDYFEDNFAKPELQALLAGWNRSTLSSILKTIMLREGKSEREAGEYVSQYVRKVDKMEKLGVVIPMPLVTLTARRSA